MKNYFLYCFLLLSTHLFSQHNDTIIVRGFYNYNGDTTLTLIKGDTTMHSIDYTAIVSFINGKVKEFPFTSSYAAGHILGVVLIIDDSNLAKANFNQRSAEFQKEVHNTFSTTDGVFEDVFREGICVFSLFDCMGEMIESIYYDD